MLSNEKLAAHYDKVTWLFVTRNFKNDAKDREAARTHDRFGITSWPHCELFDPRDDRVLADLPRDLAGFVADIDRHAGAVKKAGRRSKRAAATVARATALFEAGKTKAALTSIAPVANGKDDAFIHLWARELEREWRGEPVPIADRLADPDVRERAIGLEEAFEREARKLRALQERIRELLLDPDEHLVVRLRALAIVARDEPELVRDHAADLLAIENDNFRFQVLQTLSQHPDPELVPLLVAMFEGAGTKVRSGNPNVLRIHIARCLGAAGDPRGLPPLQSIAEAADPRNGLTHVGLKALGTLGRDGDRRLREQVVDILRGALPPAIEDADPSLGEHAERRLLGVVRSLREALDGNVITVPPLPSGWTERDRTAFAKALERARPRR